MHDIAEPIRRETAAQPGTSGLGATPPAREERAATSPSNYRGAETFNPREHTDCATATCLRQRIAALRSELAAAHLKVERINHAIASRKVTLFRLHAQLAMTGGTGAGPNPND